MFTVSSHTENKTVNKAKTHSTKKIAESTISNLSPLQAKLIIGSSNDLYEREADRMADHIAKTSSGDGKPTLMSAATPVISRMPTSRSLQRMTEEEEDSSVQRKAEEEESVQRKVEKKEEEPSVQRKSEEEEDSSVQRKAEEKEEATAVQRFRANNSKRHYSPGIAARLKARRGVGKPLPALIKARMERLFGADFSKIRIHTDAEAIRTSHDLRAQAFTSGADIYFNEGKYDPSSPGGIWLLTHELTHAIQQNAAPKKKQEKETEEVKTNRTKTGETQVKISSQSNSSQKPENSVTDTLPSKKASAPTTAASASGSGSNNNLQETPSQAPATDQQTVITESGVPQGVKTPADPEKDPAFQAVIRHTEKVKASQETHEPAEKKKEEITRAAKLPAGEQEKKNAQLDHIEVLDQENTKEREPITAESFKTMLKEELNTLEKQLPKDEESAEKFKEEEPIRKVKEELSETVRAENEKYTGPVLKEADKKDPPASNKPVEIAEELIAANPGKTPEPINAKAAVPKPKHDSEISMQKESQSMDDYMAANEITEEQLAKSNEPKFFDALNSKTEAQAAATEAPKKYREDERVKLSGAVGIAKKNGEEGLQGMFDKRDDVFGKVFENQKTNENNNKEKQKEAYGKLEGIYNGTKEKVTNKLEKLSTDVDEIFSNEVENAKNTFEENVEKKLDKIYGWTTWDDKILGEDTEAIEKVFETEKQKFINTMDKVLDRIAKRIADDLNAALKDIEDGKKESENYFNTLSEEQQKLLQDAFEDFNDKYKDLEDTVHEKQEELARDLAKTYKENVNSLSESFDKIKEEASVGWIEAAMNALTGVVETIKKLKAMFLNLLGAAADAIHVILSDPIGFLLNLIEGVKLGLQNFMARIRQHIITGLVTWLTGSLQGVGITIPKDIFSLKGIFSLVTQALGLTKAYFREKAVKLLGEKVVNVIETGAEKGMEIFQVVKEKGVEGLWEYLKEQFTDLKEVVMGAIREMVISKVIGAGIKWIMGLLSPVGAFIKAAMLIKDIVVFFVEKATQIIELVTAFINGIRALAAGNVGNLAQAIENALAKAIPVLIGFFASLVGITGLTAKVQKIIKKVRKRIDRAINKLIIKVKKKFKNLVKKGKAKVKKGIEKIINWWKIKREFKVGQEEHSLYFKGSGKAAKLIMESTPKPLEFHIKELETKYSKDEEKKNIIGKIKDQIKIINSQKGIKEEGNKKEDITMSKKRGEKIQVAFDEIVKHLASLGGEESRPASKITWKTKALLQDKVGVKMVAKPLSINPGGHRGSIPGQESDIWKAVNQRKGTYVRGHLLNHHVHGPGENKNLIPITGSLNTTMETQVESEVKKLVLGENRVVNYEVKAVGKQNKRKFIPDESKLPGYLNFKITPLKLKAGKDGKNAGSWIEDKKKASEISYSRKLENKLPADTAADVKIRINPVNLSEAKKRDIAKVLSPSIAAKIIEKRAERNDKTFHSWEQLKGVGITVKELKEKGPEGTGEIKLK